MKVKEIMKKAITIDSSKTLKEASKIMSSKNIGSLIVVENNKIVGIITERDIVKNVFMLSQKVGRIMTRKLITIGPEDSVEKASALMAKHKIKRLPVVSSGNLEGIISVTDIIANSKNVDSDFLLE